MVSTYATPTAHQYLPNLEPSTIPTASPNQYLLPLTAGVNDRDHLEIGGCDIVDLVEKFGSPLYILDETTLRVACRQYRQAFENYYPGPSQILYASKAWSCLAICAIAASEGLGLDVVSGGELYTALQAGVDAQQIYLHGNNKSLAELQLGMTAGCITVVDNWWELKTLAALAQERDIAHGSIPILLRFTPGIECHTHEYIRTGHLDSKFGFDPDQLEPVLAFVHRQTALSCLGFHAHIGSQIFELQPHRDLPGVMVSWFQAAARHQLPVTTLNVGGGLGIRYTEKDDPPAINAWAEVVSRAIASACDIQRIPYPRLLCEPGRSLVGPACVTAYTIGSQKVIPEGCTYVAVDGGMSDNPRPITYQSTYRAVVASQMGAPLTETVTLAGKHCESGDLLLRGAQLPPTRPGDVLVVLATGAYNHSMASNYNRIPRPAAVLAQNGEASIIVQRETYRDLLQQDCLPIRLKERGVRSSL